MTGGEGQRGQAAGCFRGIDNGVVGFRDEDASQRCGCQGPADHQLSCSFVLKQLRQPGDRGDHLDTHADERGASEQHQLPQVGAEGGSDRRERVRQDAGDHDGLPPQAVDQPAAEKSKDTSAQGGNPEKATGPNPDWGGRRRHSALQVRGFLESEFGQPPGGTTVGVHHDEFPDRIGSDDREHQQLIGIEEEPDRRDDDNEDARDRAKIGRWDRLRGRHGKGSR